MRRYYNFKKRKIKIPRLLNNASKSIIIKKTIYSTEKKEKLSKKTKKKLCNNRGGQDNNPKNISTILITQVSTLRIRLLNYKLFDQKIGKATAQMARECGTIKRASLRKNHTIAPLKAPTPAETNPKRL